jgi:N-acylneuraminate cytidylyltransferase
LISYSIESNLFDKVIVSTDDEEIAKIATQYGAYVPFLRSKELSDDFIGTGVENEYVCTIFTRKIPYCRI